MRRATLAALLLMSAIAGDARGDLRGPRDLERALEALDDEDDELCARAAAWLTDHGPDEIVIPALLEALPGERHGIVAPALALALAARARPEDAPALLALERDQRGTARGVLVVALAQLGAEESDAWLVERLASPPGSDLRASLEEVAEISRARREALLPRILDAIAARQEPRLVEWLASLEDERARGALLALALAPSPSRTVALEGLGRLGPDPETGRRLAELLASPAGEGVRTPELARALLAADPDADVSALLERGAPTTVAPVDAASWPEHGRGLVREATLEALVRHAPARAVAELGADPRRIAPEDAHVLSVAIEAPSPPLAPWLEGVARDATLATTHPDALEALVRIPHCALRVDDGLEAPREERALADARLSRACPTRQRTTRAEGPAELRTRAIAGEDVRDEIAARWAGQTDPPERLLLAHAWLASREPDDRAARAVSDEADPEVRSVLVAAAAAHGVPVPHGPWIARALEPEASPRDRVARIDALRVLLEGPTAPEPRLLRRVAHASRDRVDPAAAALALAVLARHTTSAEALLCASLASSERSIARVARSSLAARDPVPGCLSRRARIDVEARRALALGRGAGPSPTALAVLVASNAGGSLLRVHAETAAGHTWRLRPPRDGILFVPALGEADVTLRLDEEPGHR